MRINRDCRKRDNIIFGDSKPNYINGICRFKDLRVDKLIKLLVYNFIDDNNGHYDKVPSVRDIIGFMNEWYEYDVKVHGYVVSNDREDCRMFLDGIEISSKTDLSDELIKDISALFRSSECFKLTNNTFYCRFE